MENINKSLAIVDEHQFADFVERGMINRNLGHFEAALSDFDQAIRLRPGNPLSYYERALTYEIIADDERAADDMTKAKDLDLLDYYASDDRHFVKEP